MLHFNANPNYNARIPVVYSITFSKQIYIQKYHPRNGKSKEAQPLNTAAIHKIKIIPITCLLSFIIYHLSNSYYKSVFFHQLSVIHGQIFRLPYVCLTLLHYLLIKYVSRNHSMTLPLWLKYALLSLFPHHPGYWWSRAQALIAQHSHICTLQRL